jgi:DNA-binding NtrC family response regulator
MGAIEPQPPSPLFPVTQGCTALKMARKAGGCHHYLRDGDGESTRRSSQCSTGAERQTGGRRPAPLKLLQNGEFRPVGSNQALVAKCRVIVATSKNLAEEVKNGTFTEDLFHRVSRLVITIPPVRERKDDISLLSRFLLNKSNEATGKRIVGISRSAQSALMAHDWPGNVREMENVIEQAVVILAGEPFIKLEHLPKYLREPARGQTAPGAPIGDVIRKHLGATLALCDGNKSEASRRLGLSRRALLRWIEKYSA